MKQKDIILIGAVVIASVIFSVIVSNYIFTTPADRQQTVEVIGKITSNFTTPSSKYFNTGSIDPTQTINVNINSNQNPFGNSTQ